MMRIPPALGLVLLIPLLTAPASVRAQSQILPLENPNAEAGFPSPDGYQAVAVPGWSINGSLTVVSYGTSGPFPAADQVTAGGSLRQLFVGGSQPGLSTATQEIAIPDPLWEGIDQGMDGIGVWALLGAWGTSQDSARVVVTVLDGTGAAIQTVIAGPVTEADRAGMTTLKQRSVSVSIAAGARRARVTLEMYHVAGDYNTSSADDINVVVLVPDPVRQATWSGIKALFGS